MVERIPYGDAHLKRVTSNVLSPTDPFSASRSGSAKGQQVTTGTLTHPDASASIGLTGSRESVEMSLLCHYLIELVTDESRGKLQSAAED